ncbi:response regulator transcription factor [Tissierella pigra]|uniref:Response regulator transcription factor n=1 Tax=Tissierella pigra TaxID=2607614 RepID=A0A6N7Y367_9FIRM|nr:response regulator transcription factor [Tissierella pigra]MBU5426924.1 response regulator transcription factor [Tissierella pigra]MSU03235.1 response regulator transcription factor [Tissierella pigra]
MIRILIVEDEKPISDLIRMNLFEAGYFCDCAFDGMTAINMLDENKYDLILLDILLPEVDGYEVMEYVKPLDVPVIFLTAKASVDDRVKGLKLGADDYLVKPFEIIELLARVEAVLRRYNLSQSTIEIGGLLIDTKARTVKKENLDILLTPKEYELLIFFITNKNIALFRNKIYEKIWGGDYMGDSRTVDLHVQRLRKKLGWEQLITAVYKVGYRLEIKQ